MHLYDGYDDEFAQRCFYNFGGKCSFCGTPLSLVGYRDTWAVVLDDMELPVGLMCVRCFEESKRRTQQRKSGGNREQRRREVCWGGWAVGGGGSPF